MSIEDSQTTETEVDGVVPTAGPQAIAGPGEAVNQPPGVTSGHDSVIVTDPPSAERDQAAQEIDVLSGHVHELEVKLNERDTEILRLQAKLDMLATTVICEVTCSTCGTRTEVTHG